MNVVMVVTVNRQTAFRFRPKKSEVFRMTSDFLGFPFTAKMPVETEDTVGGSHDHMQVGGYHQDSTTPLITDLSDQTIQFGLAEVVHPLGRFIQDQQFRFTEQSPGQHHPLKLSSRKRLHRFIDEGKNSGFRECGFHFFSGKRFRQSYHPGHRKRKDRIDAGLLRQVTDTQTKASSNASTIGFVETQQQFQQAGFAGAVGTDHADDFTFGDLQ